MSKCLILSRFKEDISWVKHHKDFKLYIYNKGNEIQNSDFKNIIKLPNLGRESQTWLYHIVNNYKNLDDINFFRPKEKRPKMLENLRNIFYKMDLSDKETRILSGVFASLGKKR